MYHNIDLLFNLKNNIFILIQYHMGFHNAVQFKFCTCIFPSFILFNRVYSIKESHV